MWFPGSRRLTWPIVHHIQHVLLFSSRKTTRIFKVVFLHGFFHSGALPRNLRPPLIPWTLISISSTQWDSNVLLGSFPSPQYGMFPSTEQSQDNVGLNSLIPFSKGLEFCTASFLTSVKVLFYIYFFQFSCLTSEIRHSSCYSIMAKNKKSKVFLKVNWKYRNKI